MSENVFKGFLRANKQNKLFLAENPILCGQNASEEFRWLKEFRDQISDARCADGTPVLDFEWNSTQSSSTERYSSTSSTSSGSSGSSGSSDDFLDEILDSEINSSDFIEKSLDLIIEKSFSENSFNSSEELKKVLKICENFWEFLAKNKSESKINSKIVLKKFSKTFNQLIYQKNGWNNGTENERQSMAEKLLQLIPRTSFALNCFLSNKTSEEFKEKLLFQKFFTNFSKIEFEFEFSSIFLEIDSKDIEDSEEDNSCVSGSALAFVVSGLEQHLTSGLSFGQKINSKIVSLVLKNSEKSQELNASHVTLTY